MDGNGIDDSHNQMHQGLIVRATREYLLIWSPVHDLVRAPEYGLATKWPIGSWIQYRAISDDSPSTSHQPDINYKFTAYEICRGRRDGTQLGANVIIGPDNTDVKVELVAFITSPVRGLDSSTMLAADGYLGPILCPMDPILISKMDPDNDDEAGEVQVKVEFTEDFADKARFIATSMKDDDGEWIKLRGVPRRLNISEQCSQKRAFGTFLKKSRETDVIQTGKLVNCQTNDFDLPSASHIYHDHNDFFLAKESELGVNNIRLPDSWKGDKQFTDDEYIDVLGICIGHEESVERSTYFTDIPVVYSMVATRFGLARQPTNLTYGVWIRANIARDRNKWNAFTVLKSEKILPPMSTRVVPMHGFLKEYRGHCKFRGENPDHIILCTNILICEYTTASDRIYINPILGIIRDPEEHMPIKCSFQAKHGFFVELGLRWIPSRESGRSFEWIVLCFHGVYSPNLKAVPIKDSICPDVIGHRCDDVHTILIDKIYEADPELVEAALGIASHPTTSHQEHYPQFTNRTTAIGSTCKPYDLDADLEYLGSKSTQNLIDISTDSQEENNSVKEGSREHKILVELPHYERKVEQEGPKKRYIGIIVEKTLEYASVYTKKLGLVIAPAKRFSNYQQFDSLCVVGKWICTTIVSVPYSDDLTFSYMCLPKFESKAQDGVHTRMSADGHLELLLNCDFSICNMTAIGPYHYSLLTELGCILVSKRFILQNDLAENVVDVWVRYIGSKYGGKLFWEIGDNALCITNEEKLKLAYAGEQIIPIDSLEMASFLLQSTNLGDSDQGDPGGTITERSEGDNNNGIVHNVTENCLQSEGIFTLTNGGEFPIPTNSEASVATTTSNGNGLIVDGRPHMAAPILQDFSLYNYAKKLFGHTSSTNSTANYSQPDSSSKSTTY